MQITDFTLTKILKKDEAYITGTEFIKRADKFGDWAEKEECDWLLENQDQIPEEWRKNCFVFNWRHSDDSEYVAYVYWFADARRWFQSWNWLGSDFVSHNRVLRRKSNTRTLGTLEDRLKELEDWKIKMDKIINV